MAADTESVRAELARLLAGAEFRASKRCQEFLRYVVESTLDGRAEMLKERTIALDVFGRDPSQDANDDASVRVRAGDVRKRLARSYSSQPAPHGVVIDLPLGTYVPEFRSTAPAAPAPPRPRGWRAAAIGAGVAAVVALVAAIAAARLPGRPTSKALDAFWRPMGEASGPVPVCLSLIPVYSMRVDPPPPGPVSRDNLITVPDQFLGAGDLRAARDIGDLLARLQYPYRLRIGNELSFRELRSGPAVLVGFSYSEWEAINKSFRFFLDTDREPFAILDNGQPKWALTRHPDDPELTEDYAVVSRVFDSETHTFLIEVSGLAHFGTEAAAELVTTPEMLDETLAQAPAGWPEKNLQLVLRTKVVNGAVGRPEIVASHVW